MTVRNALLALLCQGPRHGYQLKADFDAATGEIWPLNFGQVYPALKQLEERGLVDEVDASQVTGGKAEKRAFLANEAGRSEVSAWLNTPVTRPLVDRDELSIKVLLAVVTGLADPVTVIEIQRSETLATLQSVTRLRAEASEPTATETGADEQRKSESARLAWQLHLDRMAIMTQSEIRWLDLVEDRLAGRTVATPTTSAPTTSPLAPSPTPEETATR